MNYTAVTVARPACITDEQAVDELIDEHDERGSLAVRAEIIDGMLHLYGHTTIDADDENHAGGFLRDVQDYLEEPLVIRWVGYTRLRHPPDAGQWIVTQDEIRHESMTPPLELVEAAQEDA